MGVSTDGIICFGIDLGEDLYGMPWYNEDDEEKEFEDWWSEECGYKPLHDDLYNSEGGYSETYTQERWDENWAHAREFNMNNPCPVELVMHCSYDYPMYILAVKGTRLSASRGCAESFDGLPPSECDKNTFLDFCLKYNIEVPKEGAKWLLCSLWG